MRFLGKILFIAASSCLVATQTLADPAVNWSGWYAGANAGYGWGKSDVSTTTVFSPTGYFASSSVPAIATAGSGSVSPDGFMAGLGVGYNSQMGTTVLGFDADLNYLGASDSRSATAAYPCCASTGFTVHQSVKADWLVTLRGRAGYAFDRSLVYATGGLAVASLKASAQFTDTFATASASTSESKTKTGWVLGAGYEQALENNWTVKAEYLHVRFTDVSSSSSNLTAFTPPIAFPTNTFTTKADFRTDIVRVGFNRKF